ncbi:hypothetical protein Tco_1274807 [Tanacetum coccineum]
MVSWIIFGPISWTSPTLAQKILPVPADGMNVESLCNDPLIVSSSRTPTVSDQVPNSLAVCAFYYTLAIESQRPLGGEIFLGVKKCRKSNIGDSDNTGDGGKIVGGAIGACGGIGERASEAKRSLVKSSKKLGEVFPDEAGKNGVQDLLALGSWLLGTLEASLTSREWLEHGLSGRECVK